MSSLLTKQTAVGAVVASPHSGLVGLKGLSLAEGRKREEKEKSTV